MAMLCYPQKSRIQNENKDKLIYGCFLAGSTLSVSVQVITWKKCIDSLTQLHEANYLTGGFIRHNV